MDATVGIAVVEIATAATVEIGCLDNSGHVVDLEASFGAKFEDDL